MKKICYYPELVMITESVTAALMMSQLEFWFKVREGKSFYKFLEPCEHEFYKVGDSWQEELGMSSSEIRSAFKKIGVPYKSKKAFKEAEDIFQGKYYASYYDRIRKVTYYFRNTSKVKEVFEALERREAVKGAYLPNLKDESSEDTNQQGGLCIQDNNQDFTYNKQLRQEESIKRLETHIPYLEVLKAYNEKLGAYLGVKEVLSDREKACIKHLWFNLDDGLEDFKLGFKKAAESSFLSGRLEGKHFKASLAWLLKEKHFKRILAGGYDDFEPSKDRENKGIGQMSQKVVWFNQMASHEDWNFEEIERLEQLYIDQKLAQMASNRGAGEEKWANIEI